MAPELVVREPSAADEACFLALWHGYLRFYDSELAPEVTASTWQRILDPGSPMFARLAVRAGDAVGFAVCVLHDCTWRREPVCYLEDLFVSAEQRGQGVGRALMQHVFTLAQCAGWSRVYWHTQRDNQPARRLYDSFVYADDFVRYRVHLR